MGSNIHKVWGLRSRILLTKQTEIDLLDLKKDAFCSTHRHKNKINRFVLIEGTVRVDTEFGNKLLQVGEPWEVHPPLLHRFVSLEPSKMIELAYVEKGKIDPQDIERISLGGKIIDGEEYTIDDLREKGWLDLNG